MVGSTKFSMKSRLFIVDFRAVNWEALLETVPAQLSLIFFGVLHVPINIPAVGLTAGEDNVDIDRELRAHGISNALSGLCGSIQVCSPYEEDLFASTTDNFAELPCIHKHCIVYEEWRR